MQTKFQYYFEMANKKNEFRGFRTDEFAGEGYDDLLEVTNHEMNTMGNENIQEYLHSKGIKDVNKYLQNIYNKGYTKCIWLCSTLEMLEKTYVRDMMRMEGDFDYDEYIVKEPILLDDDEEFGYLVAYKPGNLKRI